MNERIKELAKQADKWSAEEYHQLFLANESPNVQKLFREKFAELILKESFDAVANDGRFHDAKGIIRAARAVAIEHFGVE